MVKHVLADIFRVTGKARGKRETRALFELLLHSYQSRQMDWHRECLLAAWEQHEQWQCSQPGGPAPETINHKRAGEKKEPRVYPIRLEKRGRNEWEFAWPGELLALRDKLRTGRDCLRGGDLDRAGRIFGTIVRKCPYYIEVLNHLAQIEWQRGNPGGAESYYLRAWETGQSILPPDFRGRLPWGWVDNRPFLEALHGLAVVKLRRGDTAGAGRHLEQLLALDPDDHLAARQVLEDMGKGAPYRDE